MARAAHTCVHVCSMCTHTDVYMTHTTHETEAKMQRKRQTCMKNKIHPHSLKIDFCVGKCLFLDDFDQSVIIQ